MPLDALCLGGVVSELRRAALGSRIDKIYQPGRDEVLLALRGAGGNARLLLSANPNFPRLHLTTLSRENPDTPPMFCMLLRKHLSSARIQEITQPHLERIVEFRLEAVNELGDTVERRLILEAIGRRSNLILVDDAGRIVDCLRRVEGDLSSQRQLLPGMFYRPPLPQAKADPTQVSREALEAMLSQAPEEVEIDRWLLDHFLGLSPLVCRELAFRAGGAVDVRRSALGPEGTGRLLDSFEALFSRIRGEDFTPTMILREEKPFDFTFFLPEQYEALLPCRTYPGFSPLLDSFYEQRERSERIRQRGQDLIRTVTSARDRCARKIGVQEQELAATQNRERLRQFGDIITSNLYQMERGMTLLHTVDFYDPAGAEVDIPLSPLLTPQQNAAKYYKDYTRAKTAQRMLTVQLEKARGELDYLNSVLESISLAEGDRDLGEIRRELLDSGYLRRAKKAAGREKVLRSAPMEFRSSAGLRISVGKNNTQNDLLTCKQAAKGDLWFHTQKIHGSHVILWTDGASPDLKSIQEAACLAAWFSQGRENHKVPVDYTAVRYVKKPAGARPGMVIYTHYETALVSPDPDLAKRLRVK